MMTSSESPPCLVLPRAPPTLNPPLPVAYTVWKCFNFHLMLIATLSYSNFESIQLQREESAEKSNESRKMLFIL